MGAAVRAQQTRRLFGSPHEERARILALADESTASRYLPAPVAATGDRVTVVEHDASVRSGAAASAEPLPPAVSSADPLADFHATTLAAVADERDAHGPLAPAELRVGVVGVGKLIDRYGRDRTERAVWSLGDAVTGQRGMYHCHVAGPADAPETAALQSAFDARIDLRQRDDLPPEQRWSFLASGESTEWMPL